MESIRASTKRCTVRIWGREQEGGLGMRWGLGCGVVWKREQEWGAEMGRDKSPPADSGSFCEAVGLVSEAHGESPE